MIRQNLQWVTCLVWAWTPPSTSCPLAGSIPSWPEIYMVRSTSTAWLGHRKTSRIISMRWEAGFPLSESVRSSCSVLFTATEGWQAVHVEMLIVKGIVYPQIKNTDFFFFLPVVLLINVDCFSVRWSLLEILAVAIPRKITELDGNLW